MWALGRPVDVAVHGCGGKERPCSTMVGGGGGGSGSECGAQGNMTSCGMRCCVVCEGSVSYNGLGEAGAAALAPALRQLTALRKLKYVCGCRAGYGGVGAGSSGSCGGACVCGGKERQCLTFVRGVGCACVSGAQCNVCCDHVWDAVLCGV